MNRMRSYRHRRPNMRPLSSTRVRRRTTMGGWNMHAASLKKMEDAAVDNAVDAVNGDEARRADTEMGEVNMEEMAEAARRKRAGEGWGWWGNRSAGENKTWLGSVPVFGNALEKTEKLAEHVATNVAEKMVDKVGDAMGVDLDNPKSIGNKLDEWERAVTAPENVEKAKRLAKNAAQTGLVALQASKPFVDEFIEEATPVAQKGMEKATKAGIATGVNILEDFLGPIIGIPRTLMSAAEAVSATLNTGSAIVKKGTDAVDASIENYDRIQEKMAKGAENAVDRASSTMAAPMRAFQQGGGARRKKAVRQYTRHRRTRQAIQARVQDAVRTFSKTVRAR